MRAHFAIDKGVSLVMHVETLTQAIRTTRAALRIRDDESLAEGAARIADENAL